MAGAIVEAPIRHHCIPVAWRERPFDGAFHRRMIEPINGRWPTIAEIVRSNAPMLEDAGEVRINGDVICRGAWHVVRPHLKAGVPIGITLHMPMRGGGGGGKGGGKNTIAMVAMVAVLLAAAAVSGGALGTAGMGYIFGPYAGSIVGAGTIGAQLAGAAVTLGGLIAINALGFNQ